MDQHPPSQADTLAMVESYWQALRPDGRDIPARAAFSPRGIAEQLGTTLLLERIAAGQVRIRLSGSCLSDLLGMDLRGMPLSALFQPAARGALAKATAEVFDGPAIVTLRVCADGGFFQPALGGAMILLPMRGHSGAIDRALACLATTGRIGRASRRFALTGVETRPIGGIARPDLPQPAHAAPPLAAFAEPMARFLPQKPKLRVIDGGRQA